GARLVLTVGDTRSPRSTARLASKPAATITEGFEVLVQLVIAAITTEPLRTCAAGLAITAVACCFSPSTSATPPSESNRATSLLLGLSSMAKAVLKLSHTRGSATRSCGRFGPARLGSTAFRSSSSSSLKTGVGESSVRDIACGRGYRAPRRPPAAAGRSADRATRPPPRYRRHPSRARPAH